MSRLLLTAVLCVACAGCLTERTLRGVPDGERNWRIGYRDGCHSGHFRAGLPDRWEQDRDRYRADDLYRRGWKEGYDACYREGAEAEQARATVATPPPPAVAAQGTVEKKPDEPEDRAAIQKKIRALEAELSDLKGQLEDGPPK